MRRDERGSVALETALGVTVLVPLLFAALQFGAAFQRWLAQDAAVFQAARHAAELGGDAPEVRAALEQALRDAGIDPARVEVGIAPSRVGWREPVRVTASSVVRVGIPFLFATDLPLRSTAIGRGELAR